MKLPLISRRRFLAGSGAAGAMFVSRLPGASKAQGRRRNEGSIRPFMIDGDAVIVPAATYDLGGRRVTVTKQTKLKIKPADVVTVRDEELLLSSQTPGGFFAGTKLKGTLTKNIGAFRSLIEESLTLRDASGRTLRQGED